MALGIGIFIGITMDGQEIFVQQQQGLISELEQRFTELKNEKQNIEIDVGKKEKELQVYRDLVDGLLPRLVEGELKGMNMAIIQSGASETDTVNLDFLNKAGAQISSVTFIREINLADNGAPFEWMKETVDYGYMAQRLVNAILTGGDEYFINRLKECGMIDIHGEYGHRVDHFVFVKKGKTKDIKTGAMPDSMLIDAIKKHGIPITGAEESDCEVSYIEMYMKADISSVDNVESTLGQYSLIRTIQGYVGHFGVKNTAKALTAFDHGGS